MAIAYDTSTNGESSTSYAHTCTGNNGYLFVCIRTLSGVPSDVTYAGVSMTKLLDSNDTTGTGRDITVWGLAEPATGSNTVAINLGVSTTPLSIAISYTGVKKSGQPDATVFRRDAASDGSETYSVTTVADNTWSILVGHAENDPVTAATNSTQRAAVASNLFKVFDNSSVAPITPAGTSDMSLTFTLGDTTYGAQVSFAPHVQPTSGFLAFM